MIGAQVVHKVFGEGVVIGCTEGYIRIRFAAGEKEFPYLRAFDGFLSTKDPEILAELDRLRKAAAEEQARLEEEARRAEEARKADLARQEELSSVVVDRRRTAGSRGRNTWSYGSEGPNIAVKCNFCDGGRSEDCVGFRGCCSDQVISYNIDKAKHVWCSTDSECRKYYDRKITRRELEERCSCYESRMLQDWKCCAGVIRNGLDAGKPMTLRNVRKGSLAFMTTRDPGAADTSRYIFGVFLIDEYFEGDDREEGYVVCHSKWRIELKPDEAHKILFWNYYANRNAPERMVFGSGLHRYLSDIRAAQILRDIARVKKDEAEKTFAQEFFEYYCDKAGIEADELPAPSGALRRQSD